MAGICHVGTWLPTGERELRPVSPMAMCCTWHPSVLRPPLEGEPLLAQGFRGALGGPPGVMGYVPTAH